MACILIPLPDRDFDTTEVAVPWRLLTEAGHRVLSHCGMGFNRSALVAGRILHHLAHGASDPRNTILVVGFQAEHTLGRRIVDRDPGVRVDKILVDRLDLQGTTGTARVRV